MTFAHNATALAIELIRKSGVNYTDDPDAAANIVDIAYAMAATFEQGNSAVANAIYEKTGTAIQFLAAGGDVTWTCTSVVNDAGRQSALYDQGADGTARAVYWRYRVYTKLTATPTVGNIVRVLLKTSDGTHPDNDDGTGDAAVSSIDKLRNLWDLAPMVVDEAAGAIEIVSSGIVPIRARHFGLVLWNTSGATLSSTAADTGAIFTPYYAEIQ